MNCPQVLWLCSIAIIEYYPLASRVSVGPGCMNHKTLPFLAMPVDPWDGHTTQDKDQKGFLYWNKHEKSISAPCSASLR